MNLQIRHALSFLLLLPCTISFMPQGMAQELVLEIFQHSTGYQLKLPSAFDPDQSASCLVRYRKTGQADWTSGFPPDRIQWNNQDQFRGSLFLLEEQSSYELEVRLMDSVPVPVPQMTFTKTFTTLPINEITAGAKPLWVAPNGSGTAYTKDQPGSLSRLLSNSLTCGTTIMFQDGIYRDYHLSLQLTADCTDSTPIIFMAEPGAEPVMDGGYELPLNWIKSSGDPSLYTASLPKAAAFTNLALLDGRMLYPYPSVTPFLLVDTFSLSGLGFRRDGFVRDGQSISIKTRSGIDPNQHSLILSQAFRFLTVYGNDRKAYLKFKGLHFRHFAKSNVPDFTLGYAATAFDFRNAHCVSFDDCHFEYNNWHLSFDGQCDQLSFQNCSFIDQTGTWTHGMLKKSVSDQSILLSSSVARQFENAAISLVSSRHLVVRNNIFKGTNSGLVNSFSGSMIEEADVYGNLFEDNFDAIESDGLWCNLRVWNNEIIRPMAAFSIAPPNGGPRYFYRNLVHHLTGRDNIPNDPHHVGCTPPMDYRSASIGLKTNTGSPASEQAARLYFINNSFHSSDSLGFLYTLWDTEWKQLNWINNIFYGSQNTLLYFQGFLNRNQAQLYSNHDNYFTANGFPVATIKEIHGQYRCHEVQQAEMLESGLRQITKSSGITIESPFQEDPLFISLEKGGFELQAGSGMIDAGIRVPGFHDYSGRSPDLGARESDHPVQTDDLKKEDCCRIFPNPARENFRLVSTPGTEASILQLTDLFGKVIWTRPSGLLTDESLPLPPAVGCYVLRIVLKDGTNKSLMIVRN